MTGEIVQRIRAVHTLIQARTTHRQRVFTVTALLLLLYIGQLALRLDHSLINSDDVADQTALALRGKYGSPAWWFPSDTYYLKYPLYLLAQHLFGMTSKAFAFESIVDNIVLFASLVTAYWLLVRHHVLQRAPLWMISLVAFWTISLGDPSLSLTNPNSRNAELGISILLMAVLGLLYTKQLGTRLGAWSRTVLAGALGVAAGAIIFDDPYFLYALGGTVGLVAVLLLFRIRSLHQAIDEGQYLLWVFLAASGMVYVVAGKVALHSGIHLYSSSALGTTFISWQPVGCALTNTAGSIVALYNGLFFGGSTSSPGSYRLLLNALLGVTTVAIGLAELCKWRRLGKRAIRLLLPLMALVVAASYLVSSNSSEGLAVFRYLLIFMPIFLLLLPTALMELKKTEANLVVVRLLVAGLLISGIWNTVQLLRQTESGASHAAVAASQSAIVDTLAKLGLHKGYSNYWDGNTTTYFSKGSAVTMPIYCSGGKLGMLYLLIDSAWLSKPAARTYIIDDPTYSDFQQCSASDLASQFGPPARVVPVSDPDNILVYNYGPPVQMIPATGPIDILVYNYDITTKFLPRTTTATPWAPVP